MKRTRSLLLSALLCLALCCGCTTNPPIGDENIPSPAENNQPTAPDSSAEPTPDAAEASPVFLDTLTFELSVSWEDGQRLLPSLQNMAQLLQEALAAQSCQVGDVTVTLSTAGGLTGDALETGGVDLALLAAEDFAACGDAVGAVLIDSGEPCSIVLAVSGARAALDTDFCQALTAALLETDPGQSFLNLYQEGIRFVPADADTAQVIRSQVTNDT